MQNYNKEDLKEYLKFKKYLSLFEQRILIKLFENTNRKSEPVPIKKRKIHGTEFGEFIEYSFSYNKVLAFDFYGLFKISSKMKEIYDKSSIIFPSIKLMQAPAIHFSSIKKEQVQKLAPELYKDFNLFKKYLVKLRWNK